MKPEQLALARELLELTQRELAQVFDVHPRTISKWERGVQSPSMTRKLIMQGVLDHAAIIDPRCAGSDIREKLGYMEKRKALFRLLQYSLGYQ